MNSKAVPVGDHGLTASSAKGQCCCTSSVALPTVSHTTFSFHKRSGATQNVGINWVCCWHVVIVINLSRNLRYRPLNVRASGQENMAQEQEVSIVVTGY